MARTASPWSSRSAATACSHRRSHGLHARGSRAGARRWCARLDEFCKVVCVHIGGSACDPVDLKHLLILYGRKDAPCADHSTTALRSRCDRPMAYASGVCVWHMRGCACGSSRRRSATLAPPLVAPPLVEPPLVALPLVTPRLVARRHSSRRHSSRRRSRAAHCCRRLRRRPAYPDDRRRAAAAAPTLHTG